jgi:hypothetical protein
MFAGLLQGVQLNSYLNIKRRARILCQDSVTLIGVVDTDDILEAGEIYVQIRRDSFRCRNAKNEKSFKKALVEQEMNREV